MASSETKTLAVITNEVLMDEKNSPRAGITVHTPKAAPSAEQN